MRPQWFDPADLPVADMWEETRMWMPAVIALYLEPARATGAHGAREHFAHYVDYLGAVNPQTQEWDPWHGIGTSVLEWFDGPIEAWSSAQIADWAQAARTALQ